MTENVSDRPSMVDADAVEVGCAVFLLNIENIDPAELGDDEAVAGGTVYAIETRGDPETGEIHRVFSTVRNWRGALAWGHCRDDQVAQVELPNVAHLRSLFRMVAKELSKRKAIDSTTERYLDVLLRLFGAVS